MRLPEGDSGPGAATVAAALDAGITVFDTARAYGSTPGANERLLAGALRRAPRLTVTLQQVRYFRPAGGGGARWPTLIEWSPAGLIWYAVPMTDGAPGVKVATHVTGRAVDPRDGPFDEIDPARQRSGSGCRRM